jgi:hypothetical protein
MLNRFLRKKPARNSIRASSAFEEKKLILAKVALLLLKQSVANFASSVRSSWALCIICRGLPQSQKALGHKMRISLPRKILSTNSVEPRNQNHNGKGAIAFKDVKGSPRANSFLMRPNFMALIPLSKYRPNFMDVKISQKNIKLTSLLPGLPDFSWCMIPKPGKMYQMNTKCTK